MGAFLDKPKTDKHNESGEGNGLRYGLAAMQGWRVEMEDAHCAVTGMKGHLKDWSFFAVFDGHAGARASTYCATQLLEAIVGSEDFRKFDADNAPTLQEVKKGLKDGFLELDTRLRATNEVRNGEDKSGSTAVTVLLSPTNFFFANCGDSRAMLITNSSVEFATEDHKPGNPNERERIVNAGGSVIIQRVNGSLAVSRALGDFEYKNVVGKGPCEQLVSPEPEITIVPRKLAENQLIVLACDGVWDVMTNEELCAFLLSRMRISSNLTEICNQVIDTCLYKGSRDNMSIVVVALNNAPKPDPESIAKEKQLDEAMERRTREMFEACEDITDIDLSRVLHRLGEEFDAQLPPGGGLAAKRLLIEEVYTRLHDEFSKKLMRKGNVMPNPIQSSASARRTAAMAMGLRSNAYESTGNDAAYASHFGMELESDERLRVVMNDEEDDPLLLDREPVRDRADAINDDGRTNAARYTETPVIDAANGPTSDTAAASLLPDTVGVSVDAPKDVQKALGDAPVENSQPPADEKATDSNIAVSADGASADDVAKQ